MFYIILLILLGLLFLVAEIVLLPGVSVGALLALVCDGSAIYLAFRYHDTPTGIAVVALVVVLSLVVRCCRCAPRPGSAFRCVRKSIRRACRRPRPGCVRASAA